MEVVEFETRDSALHAEEIMFCIAMSKATSRIIRLKTKSDGMKFAQIDITPIMNYWDCIENINVIDA